MNLFDKENIIKIYNKILKRSIDWTYSAVRLAVRHILQFYNRVFYNEFTGKRIDFFLIFWVLALIITPLIINFYLSFPAVKTKYTELAVSPQFTHFFGYDFSAFLLDEFTETNPEIIIVQSDEPDILFFEEGDISVLINEGALLPLETYDSSYMYTVPLVSFMDLLFYNIELLSEAGFDRPPKTRDDFLLFAAAVSSGNNEALAGASGTALSLSGDDRRSVPRDIFSWVWASGNNFWQNENTPVINTRPIIRDITFLGNLYNAGVFAPYCFNMTGDQILDEFAKGKIAMIIASSRAIVSLREIMGDDAFGITTIPDSGLGGRYSIGISSIYAAVSADCAYPEAAWKFLDYLASSIPLLCAELKAVPGDISNIFSGSYMQDDLFYTKARDIYESARIAQGFSGVLNGEKFEDAVREEMLVFFETGRTAEQTAAAIQQRWEEISDEL